jgi:Transposase, Mutator family
VTTPHSADSAILQRPESQIAKSPLYLCDAEGNLGDFLAVALGFWKAIEKVFPGTKHQWCWVHKIANVLNKVAFSVQVNMKADLREIYGASTRAAAEAAIGVFADKYRAKYEKAVACLGMRCRLSPTADVPSHSRRWSDGSLCGISQKDGFACAFMDGPNHRYPSVGMRQARAPPRERTINMHGMGNYGAASELREARHDFREARQETNEARQDFAQAREQLQEARPDFSQGNIWGGMAHQAEERQDLVEARQDRTEGNQHLAQGYEDQASGFNGFDDPGFIPGGFGPSGFGDPRFTPFGPSGFADPGFTPFGPSEGCDPGFDAGGPGWGGGHGGDGSPRFWGGSPPRGGCGGDGPPGPTGKQGVPLYDGNGSKAGSETKAPSHASTAPTAATAPPGDVVAQARTELGRNAHDVKLGSDAIGKAMCDDVSDWKNCANFVSGALVAAGQITSKDMSASVDGLMDKLRKTGNFTESHSLADVQKGDVVAFDHAHVMICTGFDAKGQPTFIGSNNENKDGSQKISEGPLTKWFNPNSATLKAWEDNVVIMHRN